MIKEFLLHKDKEKVNPQHIQAHLSLPDTKANTLQAKEPEFRQHTKEQEWN